jgi:hypothetical protein
MIRGVGDDRVWLIQGQQRHAVMLEEIVEARGGWGMVSNVPPSVVESYPMAEGCASAAGTLMRVHGTPEVWQADGFGRVRVPAATVNSKELANMVVLVQSEVLEWFDDSGRTL